MRSHFDGVGAYLFLLLLCTALYVPGLAALPPIDRDESREHIRLSLESLPTETRTLLVLRYYTDLNSTEIGKIFDLPEATVRSRLHAARQKLADTLRRRGYRHDG